MANSLTEKHRKDAAKDARAFYVGREKEFMHERNTKRTIDEFETYGVIGLNRFRQLGIDVDKDTVAMIASEKGLGRLIEGIAEERQAIIESILGHTGDSSQIVERLETIDDRLRRIENNQQDTSAKLDMILNLLQNGQVVRPTINTVPAVESFNRILERTTTLPPAPLVYMRSIGEVLNEQETREVTHTDTERKPRTRQMHPIENGKWTIKWKIGKRPRMVVEAYDFVNEHINRSQLRWPSDTKSIKKLMASLLTLARYEGIDIFCSLTLRSTRYGRVVPRIARMYSSHMKALADLIN